jgi:hypothetical protein
MALDLGALSTATTSATGLSNLILATPQKIVGIQPQKLPVKPGVAASQTQLPPFLFHYEGEQSVQLDNEITDHYVEDNTAVNDHIALKPEIIHTQGFIGELTDILPSGFAPAQFLAEKLKVLGPYTPAFSTTALNVLNNASQIYSIASNLAGSAVSAWNSITGKGSQTQNVNGLLTPMQTKQQIAFATFYGYRQNRTLFTVQTPWGVFTDMAIQSLRAVQDADTDQLTTFECTFKKMRFAKTKLLSIKQVQARLNAQSQTPVSTGTNQAQLSTKPFASSLLVQKARG